MQDDDDIVSDLDRSRGWLENAINELKGSELITL